MARTVTHADGVFVHAADLASELEMMSLRLRTEETTPRKQAFADCLDVVVETLQDIEKRMLRGAVSKMASPRLWF